MEYNVCIAGGTWDNAWVEEAMVMELALGSSQYGSLHAVAQSNADQEYPDAYFTKVLSVDAVEGGK